MKHLKYITWMLLVVLCAACEQMQLPDTDVIIEREKATDLTANSAVIEVEFYPTDATIKTVEVYYTEGLHYSKVMHKEMLRVSGLTYRAELTNLNSNTKYQVYYLLKNAFSTLEVNDDFSFRTAKNNKPSNVIDTVYHIDFRQTIGAWTVRNYLLPEGMGYVWQKTDQYGMKASAFLASNHASEAWLISPPLNLTSNTTAYLTFDQTYKYGDVSQLSVKITKNGLDWTTLEVPTWPDGTSWDFINSGEIDITKYISANTQIAYAYTSSTDGAPTWEIRDVLIKGNGTRIEEPATSVTVPTVVTSAVTQIAETTAVAGGNVKSDGGASVTGRGVVYSTSQNPTTANSRVASGSGTGAFVCNLTDLQPNTTYYVRAYAVNSKGTSYGEQVTFTTLTPIVVPTVMTSTITQITETTAVAGGNVTSDGGTSVTERGVVYSTSTNPTTASNKVISGSGMGAFTCNLTGLQHNTTYYVRAYAVNSKGTSYGEQESFTTNEEVIATPEYVDLGLSVKWATFNVGANKPEDYGDYFAWGETESKNTYSWSTYKWCNGSSTTLTKYCTSSSYGNVDNKKTLELSDDAAYANWGGEWRIPTDAELTELRTQCTWTWTTQDGVNGYKVTGTNGNCIFLPTAGYRYNSSLGSAGSYGYYWSSTLEISSSSFALNVGFNYGYVSSYRYDRYFGRSVRPVYGPQKEDTNNETCFSVSATKKVTFSPGNLQYHPANNQWRFAENQTDYIGASNRNCSSSYNGWLDLFGWSTSTTYFGVSTSTDWENDYDYLGSFVDWGTNKIGADAPNTWRTLTYNEWEYLLNTRPNASALKGVAQVNGVNGLILLPDNWTCPSGVTFKSGFHSDNSVGAYSQYQTFTADQWSKLEAAGAVFLPAAGDRYGSTVNNVQRIGYYWFASEYNSLCAYYLGFYSDEALMYNLSRYYGLSVRLVKDL